MANSRLRSGSGVIATGAKSYGLFEKSLESILRRSPVRTSAQSP